MNKTRVALGCLDFVLGEGGGLLVGARSSYAHAGLVTSSRETRRFENVDLGLASPFDGLEGRAGDGCAITSRKKSVAP